MAVSCRQLVVLQLHLAAGDVGVDGAADEEEDDDLTSNLFELITCAGMHISQAADSHHQPWTIRAAVQC